MYHYVRSPSANLPFFTYLDREDFCQQLDYFSANFGFVAQDDFAAWIASPIENECPAGVILTFDDGFRDHVESVQPILRERGLWGIFYIPTQILTQTAILDVHRIHLLLGGIGASKSLKLLLASSAREMFPDHEVEAFRVMTYTRQASSSDDAKTFKRMLNYYIDFAQRTELLDQLEELASSEFGFSAPSAEEFYCTGTELQSLSADGHIIGSHTVSHRLMSKLSWPDQLFEIAESKRMLHDILGMPVETYCHPYGGYHSFDASTEELLTENGFRYSFSVEARDIVAGDVIDRPHALPRYDCNLFPHGQATVDSGSE